MVGREGADLCSDRVDTDGRADNSCGWNLWRHSSDEAKGYGDLRVIRKRQSSKPLNTMPMHKNDGDSMMRLILRVAGKGRGHCVGRFSTLTADC